MMQSPELWVAQITKSLQQEYDEGVGSLTQKNISNGGELFLIGESPDHSKSV